MGSEETGRQLVAQRGLTPAAVAALVPLMADVGFEALGEVKALLRRFFSDGPWTALDAGALARAVGPPPPSDVGTVVRRRLDDDLTLVAGWVDGAFAIDVEVDAQRAGGESSGTPAGPDLARTFAYRAVPEPTPNPRTIRFATADRSLQASRGYKRGDHGADPAVTAIFAVDDDVADVLVGSDFVAVSVSRPRRWPELLEPVLAAVDAAYAGDATARSTAAEPDVEHDLDVRGVTGAPARSTTARRATRLDRAWADLGGLDPNDPDGVRALANAAQDSDSARRQVAARLLGDAALDDATPIWRDLLADGSRAVRRATLDAIVDTERDETRPLLELALADADAWVRWKALHGLVLIGPEPSVAAIEPLHDDPDFRVRLEATNATARRGSA
jgi:hypothetical protein